MTNQQIINPADLIAWGDEFRRRAEYIEKVTWDFIEFLGDGYRAYGDAIYDQVDKQHYALGTLRNMVTTALNFPASRRRELPQLSPAHYQVVNSIKDRELQAVMLRWAKENEATRDGLREECKRLGLLSSGDKTALELSLEVHALSAEVAATNGRIAALQAQIDAAPLPFVAPYPTSYNGTAPDLHPADVAYAISQGSEWLTGRCECGGELVCRRCGKVQG